MTFQAWLRRFSSLAVIGGLFLVCGVPSAVANEADDALAADAAAAEAADTVRVEAFAEQYKLLKSDKKLELVEAKSFASKIVNDFPKLTHEKQREKLVDIIGKIAKLDRDQDYLHLSLETLASVGHLHGAKYIKRHLRMRGQDDARDTLKIAIRTAAKVPDESLVTCLLRAYQRSEIMSVRVMACDALGHFRGSKRYRRKILKCLIDVVKRVRPSQGYQAGQIYDLSKGRRAGSSGGEVWGALSSKVPASLNLLTGLSIASMEQWFTTYDDSKSNIKGLFVARASETAK